MRKLSSKLLVTQLAFLAVALLSIGLTLFVTWKLEGSAAAINDAGSLRMRAYRLAYLTSLDVRSPDEASSVRALVENDIAEFERVYHTLRVGDPVRPLFLPESAKVAGQLEALDRAWKALTPVLLSREGPDRARIEAFVSLVNQLVVAIEEDVTAATSLLRATQLGLVALAIAGTVALMYLSFLFVLRPVGQLQEGLERMAQADFSLRLPVESNDEFGNLAAGFNNMAERLQGVYATLESRVAEKTRSLAEQNTRLATLYDMATFMNAPHALEELCRGFLRRLISASGAAAGAVRLSGHGEDSVHLFVGEGLSEAFVASEQTVRCGECACGDAVARQRPVVHALGERRLTVTLPHCHDAGFATVAAVPIALQHQTVGIFNLFFREPREIAIEERHVLETLGQHLGVAIENLRLAARERELAVSEERNLLAQELHDSIAQALAFLNLQVQMLRDELKKNRVDEARAIVSEIQEGVQESYADVRELLTHFRTRIAEADIEQALRSMLAKFQHQTGIQARLRVAGTGVPLETDTQLQVVHIVHEALSNARKHAECSQVDVELERGQTYRLTVSDDGRGFDPAAQDPAAREEHVGLRIMAERATRIGAKLAVESRPGSGTKVSLVLPLAQKEAA